MTVHHKKNKLRALFARVPDARYFQVPYHFALLPDFRIIMMVIQKSKSLFMSTKVLKSSVIWEDENETLYDKVQLAFCFQLNFVVSFNFDSFAKPRARQLLRLFHVN